MMISAASGFINQSEKYSRDNAGKSLKKYTLLKQGELAYNHGASKLREFGCCFELEEQEARIPYVYHSFAVKAENRSYIAMLLNNPIIDRQLKRLVSSSVRMDGLLNISFDEYMRVILQIPNIKEQTHIVNFFNLLDERIKKQQQLIDSLKLYKRGASNILFSEIETSCDDWLPLQELFAVVPDKKYQVQTNQYFAEGAFEVVDQGKNDIVGFNNDETKLFNDTPVIVYGDHTTIVKYRRKPFIVGGDGVKLLKPKLGFNPQYLYFALCHYNIKQEGYKRHFSILKEISLPIPPIDTQISIKNLLVGIEKKIAMEELLLTNLTEIKSGLLQQMFI